VRGAGTRANPAEAVPGIRPDDRQAVAEHTLAPPTPRNGTVRGSMSRPRLPKRRAQEHIAPELRGGPAPRQESEFPVEHDPGLMAAFQRGIGLAEAQHREAELAGGLPVEPGYAEPGYAEPAYGEADRIGPDHMDGTSFGGDPPVPSERPQPSVASVPSAPPGVPAPFEPSAPSAPGHGLTVRHDGSTPAG
jgi:hypothetical protein